MRLYDVCSMQLDNWAEDILEAADIVAKYLESTAIDLELTAAEMKQEAEAMRSHEGHDILTDAYCHPWIKRLDIAIHDIHNYEIGERNALCRIARNLCNSVAGRIEACELHIK